MMADLSLGFGDALMLRGCGRNKLSRPYAGYPAEASSKRFHTNKAVAA